MDQKPQESDVEQAQERQASDSPNLLTFDFGEPKKPGKAPNFAKRVPFKKVQLKGAAQNEGEGEGEKPDSLPSDSEEPSKKSPRAKRASSDDEGEAEAQVEEKREEAKQKSASSKKELRSEEKKPAQVEQEEPEQNEQEREDARESGQLEAGEREGELEQEKEQEQAEDQEQNEKASAESLEEAEKSEPEEPQEIQKSEPESPPKQTPKKSSPQIQEPEEEAEAVAIDSPIGKRVKTQNVASSQSKQKRPSVAEIDEEQESGGKQTSLNQIVADKVPSSEEVAQSSPTRGEAADRKAVSEILSNAKAEDERPLKSAANVGYNLDKLDEIPDTYVPSNKTASKKKPVTPQRSVSPTKNELDEKPIGGKSGYNLDNLDSIPDTYVPSKKALPKKTVEAIEKVEEPKNEIDEKPIGGKSGYNLDNLDAVEDTYVPSKKAATKKTAEKAKEPENEVDEKPIGGKGGYDLDNLDNVVDTYVPSKKAATKKAVDKVEKVEELKNEVDEKPIGGKSGYNLDNLDSVPDTYVPSKKAAAKKPAEKVEPPKSETDEKPVGGAGGYNLDNLDSVPDTYVPSKKAAVKKPAEKIEAPVNDADEKPIGGKSGYNLDNLDSVPDTYVPSKKAAPKKPAAVNNDLDEKPLGGGSGTGGYNLDNLDAIPDTYVPSKKAAVKNPAPQTTNSEMDEKPIGGKAGYDLDNMEEMEKNYKPSGKVPAIKRPNLSKAKESVTEEVEIKEPVRKAAAAKVAEEETVAEEKKSVAPIKRPVAKKPVEVEDKSELKEAASSKLQNDGDELPIGKGSNNKQFAEEGAYPPGETGAEGEGDNEGEQTLEDRLKSSKFQTRIAAYKELTQWNDPEFTPEIFAKGLHLAVKEKHPQVIDELLSAIESLLETKPAAFAAVDFKKFMLNFTEHLLNNVKGASKDHSSTFIVKLYETVNKEEFLEQVKVLLATIKMKVQEKALVIVFELLKAGKIEEMKYLKALWPDLEKHLTSRTPAVKNAAYDIYKEAFLWMGEGLKAFLTNLKKPQMDELEAYFKTVDASAMKTLKKADGAKAKAFDVYDIATEAELPKKYNDDAWTDEVMAMTKWNERKDEIERLNEFLAKNPKLNSKTNGINFMTLAKKLFMESNVAVQVSAIKMLGLLAAGLRKHFVICAKTIFPTLLAKMKEKNRALSEEILLTLEKFYLILTFDETHDELKEHFGEKNTDKKINLLKLMLVMIDKLDRIKTEANAVKAVKMVLKLIDENDSTVREYAAQVVAKLKDNFSDKVTPLLSDLNSQKMSKILKYCQNTSSIVASDVKDVKGATGKEGDKKSIADVDDAQKGSKRKVLSSMSKDKSQMIAEMRENLFSNKTVKLSDVKNFSNFLYTNLKNLSELTKDFKEVSTTQTKEIFFVD